MICPHCTRTFTPRPWPSTHQTYCSHRCMQAAFYRRHKKRLDAKVKVWCQQNRELRLEVQRRWNVTARAKASKLKWQREHYPAWYAQQKINGGVKLISARTTSRRRLLRHRPDRQCVRRGLHEGRIECHHKDGNSLNTKLSNLEWLCFRHHRRYHGKLRDPKPQLGVRGSSRQLALKRRRTGS